MEQLDHRQLLSVNFSGNVVTDFPASQQPGVVVIPDNPSVTHPGIPPDLQNLIKVSGFDINGIRVSYNAAQDILSIGLEQPPSQQPGQPGPVIAGDADNNGNDGTVNPAVSALRPNGGFLDFPDNGGSEFMGAFLDLKQTGYADVVAGYSVADPRSPKLYQVAQAIVNTNAPPTTPDFGTPLPANTGNVYKVNSPVHPNLEFNVDHFSQLYLQETGKALTPDSLISIGAFGGSGDDDGVGEGFFPEVQFTLKNATIPPPPVCPPPPPVSPPILINPHEHRHINTAHPTEIRVNLFGTSGFDVTQIDPATVTFGGAHPIFSFTKNINRDEFLDETFVFKGNDIQLPPGVIEAPIIGKLRNGQAFTSTSQVFNRDYSFYSPGDVSQAQSRQAAHPGNLLHSIPDLQRKVELNGGHAVSTGATTALRVDYAQPAVSQVVSIRRRQPGGGPHHGSQISPRMHASINSVAASQVTALSTSAG